MSWGATGTANPATGQPYDAFPADTEQKLARVATLLASGTMAAREEASSSAAEEEMRRLMEHGVLARVRVTRSGGEEGALWLAQASTLFRILTTYIEMGVGQEHVSMLLLGCRLGRRWGVPTCRCRRRCWPPYPASFAVASFSCARLAVAEAQYAGG